MSKFSKIAAVLAVVPVLAFSAPVFADSPGDLAGGADIYQVRNDKNTTWGSSASATCGETVKYSVKLSNTDFGTITNINVKASLTTGAMTATGTAADGKTTSTSGSVNVTLTDGSLEYKAGSTVLVDTNGATIKALPDGVTSNGVTVDSLAGSTREFVQFKADVVCTPTQPKQIQVCRLSDKQIVTINEDQYDSSKYSKDLSKCETTPPQQIQVCRLSDKQVVTITEDQFDSKKYSKDLNDCKVTPPANKIQVCELSSKNIVMIDENSFDSSKYSKDLNACKTTPTTPETPTVLPNTGAGSVAGIFAGVTAVATAAYSIYQRRQNAR